jgi:hypothetical protein
MYAFVALVYGLLLPLLLLFIKEVHFRGEPRATVVPVVLCACEHIRLTCKDVIVTAAADSLQL